MSLVVVRCPACLGESRVAPEALGLLVGCPRCEVPFIAAEEVVPVVHPVSRSLAPGRSASAVPVEPPRRGARQERPREEPDVPPQDDDPPVGPSPIPDPEHDPHLPPPAGLPVSVLVGLALLPLAIPVFWWAAPVVTGQAPALSLAVPLSLAFAATTLCLGVVYTIDWTGPTRIKGVLMLVGLAYLAAAGLYFLKKDMVDRVQRLGGAGIAWRNVEPDGGAFHVRMPGEAQQVNEQPLPKVRMTGWEAKYESEIEDVYRYLVATGAAEKEQGNSDDVWIDALGAHFAQSGKVTDSRPVAMKGAGHAGHEWTIQVAEDKVRVVQVYVISGRIYYLSVEGRNVTPTDKDLAEPFFGSFQVVNPNDRPKGKAKR